MSKMTLRRIALLLLCAFVFCTTANAISNNNLNRDQGRAYLNQQYPKLTQLFSEELDQLKVTYLFAIDVSGTMNQYQETVIPAMQNFIKSVPNGDMIKIIRFGNEARGNQAGYSVTLTNESRADLLRNSAAIYNNSCEPSAFTQHTDITRMMMTLADAIHSVTDSYIYVFILTDFRNDTEQEGECLLKSQDVLTMRSRLESALIAKGGKTKYVRIVTLQLPVDITAKGYCLPQLRDGVFQGLQYEAQTVNSPATLNDWFLDLRKSIWIQRLRSVVQTEGDDLTMEHHIKISIDGKVKIQTTRKRLGESRRSMGDETQTSINILPKNGTNTQYQYYGREWQRLGKQSEGGLFEKGENGDVVFPEVYTGDVKHTHWGLHYCTDSLSIRTNVKSDYDDELQRLEIPLSQSESHFTINQWVFTFFLPFWVCCVIVLLILFYLILVYRAFVRNHSKEYDFQGRIEVTDTLTRAKQKQNVLSPVSTCSIGNGGVQMNVRGARWRFEIYKKTRFCFTLRKPRFMIRVIDGKVLCASENWKLPQSDANDEIFEGSLTFKCGTEADKQPTHKVTVYEQ